MAEQMTRRRQEVNDISEEMESHPRFAILPSPDKLDQSINSSGEDRIATLKDFHDVWSWVTTSGLLNTGFYKDTVQQVEEGRQLEPGLYNTLIRIALKDVFDHIRNTANPEKEEMVLLYYTGHGRDGESPDEQNGSPTPHLVNTAISLEPNYFEAADDFITHDRQLQGGEFCLHHIGYCDLEGLLRSWIAALKEKSINLPSSGVLKKNKHLVVIADSCYSGKLAEDLASLATKTGPWNENECSVTVQAACSADEPTFGGYFTPFFVYFNQPENRPRLEELKKTWGEKNQEEKDYFKAIELPSPMVVSTGEHCLQPPTMERVIQGFTLILFPYPAFFKFCYVSTTFNQPSDLHFRALTNSTANSFLEQRNFTVLDYKLKTMTTGHYKGTPMGLFLLDDTNRPNPAVPSHPNPADPSHPNPAVPSHRNLTVCAHIHFPPGDTSPLRFTAINFVHHVHTPGAILVYPEESPSNNFHLNTPDARAKRLVKACHQYVMSNEPDRWKDVSSWNMRSSFKRLFKRSKSKCLLPS